ncbi:MAG: NmrA/HSCARG family protein [Bacteroidota bacterium]|nr:NmrA/HSCARG family protein [Bacteroidota bacterium]
MADKPIILVTGATGAQGGSVAHFLAKSGKYKVRALTRDAHSKKAAALGPEGVEVVEGNLDDKGSLLKAMKDCYGVFGVTNFWEHFEKEAQQGRNLIDAVKESNIEHFVLSSLPPVNKISGGELSSPHFDIKADYEDYARSLKLNSTFTHVAFYFDNFLSFFAIKKGEDGNFHFGFPQSEKTKLGGVAVGDVGGVIAGIFENKDQYLGKTIRIVGDALYPQDYARIMSEILGVKVIFDYIDRNTFTGFDFPGAADIADMFEFYSKFIPDEQKPIEESKKLFPAIKNFETWLSENKSKFDEIVGK